MYLSWNHFYLILVWKPKDNKTFYTSLSPIIYNMCYTRRYLLKVCDKFNLTTTVLYKFGRLANIGV